MRKLFGWCVEPGLLDKSPCDGLRAPGKERSPDRVLTTAELKAVWHTCGQLNVRQHVVAAALLARRAQPIACRLVEQLGLDAPAEQLAYGREHWFAMTVCPGSTMRRIAERRSAWVTLARS